jgi:hypothetical protein
MANNFLDPNKTSEAEARRAFLKNCAKYAATTPPAIALLLSADKAKANHFSAGDPQCQDPGSPNAPPHCPPVSGAEFTGEEEAQGTIDPEVIDPELEAQ